MVSFNLDIPYNFLYLETDTKYLQLVLCQNDQRMETVPVLPIELCIKGNVPKWEVVRI